MQRALKWKYILLVIPFTVYYFYLLLGTFDWIVTAPLQCKKKNYFMLETLSGRITHKYKTSFQSVIELNNMKLNSSIIQYNPTFYDKIAVGDSLFKQRCSTVILIVSSNTNTKTLYDANYGCASVECDSLVSRPYLISK
jgi:hypothetical protein